MSDEQTEIGHTPISHNHDAKAILQARAKMLARPTSSRNSDGGSLQVMEFKLAHERYAIERSCIREVYPFKDLTPLPSAPAFILGLIGVRGQILPVIDIKRFFDLPQTGITDLHVVIIVQVDDIELGILADIVVGVHAISLDSIQTTLPTLTGIRERYLKGVTNDQVVILDVAKILADPKIVVNEEVEA